MSQLHAMLCSRYVQHVTRCQLWPFQLRECVPRVSEKPQSEVIEVVISVVCEAYNLTYAQLSRKNRKREVVKARQIAMYFLKKHTKLTLRGIGDVFDGLHHTSVLYAIETVKDVAASYPDYRHELTQLENRIKYKI